MYAAGMRCSKAGQGVAWRAAAVNPAEACSTRKRDSRTTQHDKPFVRHAFLPACRRVWCQVMPGSYRDRKLLLPKMLWAVRDREL